MVSGWSTYQELNRLEDGAIDGLDGASSVTLSPDGNHLYVTGQYDDAVSWYERNVSTGVLTHGGILKDGVDGVDGLDGASSVTLSPDGNHLYVTGENDHAVSWYERNASTGALTYGGMLKDHLNVVEGLAFPTSVTLSSDGNHAYVIGAGDNAVSWYERNASTGALTYGGMLKDGVDGVDGLAFPTSVTLSSDGNHAYVTGAGDNAVSWYERNASTGALTYGGMLKDGVDGVDGLYYAKGVTLSTDGKHAYVTGSKDDAVSWYERNASTGALTYGGVLKDGVDGVEGLDYARGVILSSDGKLAYVTGYYDHAVSWFERNTNTGALTYGGMLKDGLNGVDGLKNPRSVILSSDGNHAYVASAGYSDALSWYDRNTTTGALTFKEVLKDGVSEGLDGLSSPHEVTLSFDGNYVYVTGQYDDAVSWYWRDADAGTLIYGGVLKDGVDGVDGLDGAGEIILSSDGKHAYVTGVEDDAVSWYERNASTGALSYGGMLKDGLYGVDGLDGASVMTLSPGGNYIYVTGQHDDAVSWYERNASTGALTYRGVLKDGVDGVDGLDGALYVTLSSDGNYAYVTGRDDNTTSWFSRNASTGALSYVGMLKDGVDGVDGLDGACVLALSPDEKHAYVTGIRDDAVSWYERNASTGALSYVGMLKDGVDGVDGLRTAFGVLILRVKYCFPQTEITPTSQVLATMQ